MNRRVWKNYFPEPRFQMKFLFFLMAGTLVQVAVTYSVIGYFVAENYRFLVKYAALDSEILGILSGELASLIWVMAGAAITFMMGILVVGMGFSHRVAGPIFALRRTIRELSEGKDARLKLRQGDQFTDLADEFNSLVSQLKQKSAA